jgi:tetratricopeptide (TPR) repeat protein
MAVGFGSTAAGDTITFMGSNIPLRDCRIQALRGGSVHYLDGNGRRQQRSLDQVSALGFDGLAELDQAESALNAGDLEPGFNMLLVAMLKAQPGLQRLWLHVRLWQAHTNRGEHIQAAGHAAAVMSLSDDPHWRGLEPAANMNEPAFPAAKESLESLQSALKSVKNADLRASIDRMIRRVQPVHDRLARRYTGPPIPAGSTISGVSTHDLARLMDQARPVPAGHPATEAPAPRREDSPRDAAASRDDLAGSFTDPGSPQSLDALLGAKRWLDALAACERIAVDPGTDRELGHFLFQYGIALDGAGRAEDAAIMFARCAVLFPESPDASQSLIHIAIIYRDHHRQIEQARRLLQRAAEHAAAHGHDAAAMLAGELLGSP